MENEAAPACEESADVFYFVHLEDISQRTLEQGVDVQVSQFNDERRGRIQDFPVGTRLKANSAMLTA